jgi:hypothetical protein
MKDYILNSTLGTPEVVLDVSNGILTIKGICTPENPKMFFDPLMKNLAEYSTGKSKLQIEVYLDYFNSGSSKALLNLFLDSANKFSDLIIRWISEDEELKESGLILEEITGLKFEYIDLPEQN